VSLNGKLFNIIYSLVVDNNMNIRVGHVPASFDSD
jgi:hypothetical protein